jgi:hypothetical protein
MLEVESEPSPDTKSVDFGLHSLQNGEPEISVTYKFSSLGNFVIAA